PIADVETIVNRIWDQAGITFEFQPIAAVAAQLSQADVLRMVPSDVPAESDRPGGNELARLMHGRFIEQSVNGYFVRRLENGAANDLALTFRILEHNEWHIERPCIVVHPTTASGMTVYTDAASLAPILAHELGHYFWLEHPLQLAAAGQTSSPVT